VRGVAREGGRFGRRRTFSKLTWVPWEKFPTLGDCSRTMRTFKQIKEPGGTPRHKTSVLDNFAEIGPERGTWVAFSRGQSEYPWLKYFSFNLHERQGELETLHKTGHQVEFSPRPWQNPQSRLIASLIPIKTVCLDEKIFLVFQKSPLGV